MPNVGFFLINRCLDSIGGIEKEGLHCEEGVVTAPAANEGSLQR